MKHIAVYGSLKEGFWNHKRFPMGDLKSKGLIRGAMFVDPMLGYPYLFEEPLTFLYDVEIYEVDDETYNAINSMEQGAGYYPVERSFAAATCDWTDTEKATIWFAGENILVKPKWFVREFTQGA